MSRKRQRPNFWETPDENSRHFGRVFPELVKHDAFKALSTSAKLLYLEMLEASAGKIEFTFTVTHYKDRGWTSPKFQRAKNELIKAKFITVRYSGKTNRKPNKYAFCKDWME